MSNSDNSSHELILWWSEFLISPNITQVKKKYLGILNFVDCPTKKICKIKSPMNKDDFILKQHLYLYIWDYLYACKAASISIFSRNTARTRAHTVPFTQLVDAVEATRLLTEVAIETQGTANYTMTIIKFTDQIPVSITKTIFRARDFTCLVPEPSQTLFSVAVTQILAARFNPRCIWVTISAAVQVAVCAVLSSFARVAEPSVLETCCTVRIVTIGTTIVVIVTR